MTIRAEQATDDNIRILITEGPVEISVVEEHEHLRLFWHDLGSALGLTKDGDAVA
jgi:hypothetical protein